MAKVTWLSAQYPGGIYVAGVPSGGQAAHVWYEVGRCRSMSVDVGGENVVADVHRPEKHAET